MQTPTYLVTQAEDEKLVVAAQHGSKLAFNTLIYRHRDETYKLAYRILYKPNGHIDAVQSADDVLQEACLCAWKYIGSCKPDSFHAWFRGIVRNECKRLFQNLMEDWENIDLYADVETIEDYGNWMISDFEVPPLPPLPEEKTLSQMIVVPNSELIDIAKLPKQQRNVFTLFLLNYKNKEISQKLSISVKTVRVNLRKARANLKKYKQNTSFSRYVQNP